MATSAAVEPTLLAVSGAVTAQIAVAVIVSAVFCPILVGLYHYRRGSTNFFLCVYRMQALKGELI